MTDIVEDSYISLLESRYSCRRFTDEQLTDAQLETILEAARISPTGKNLQPVRICVVQCEDGLAKIDACTDFRYGAPTVLIIAYDAQVAATLPEGFGPETCTFGDIDASIAITNMENAAASLGLNSCWIGGFDAKAVRDLFDLPENYKVVELLVLGHGDARPSRLHGDRHPLSDMVFRERF